jgi:hypothetical protein
MKGIRLLFLFRLGSINQMSEQRQCILQDIYPSVHKMYLRAEVFIERCRFHSGTYLSEPKNTGCLLSLVGDSCRHSNSFDEPHPSWPCAANSFADNFRHLLGTSKESERRGYSFWGVDININLLKPTS